MSIAKIHTVARSRKEYTCEKCRDIILAGSTYRHFTVGFRSRYKHTRCMKTECTPRLSELESSRVADVYDAQENAEDLLNALPLILDDSLVEEIEQILQDLAEAIRGVADEYRTASENESGTVFNQDAADRADILESAADEIEGHVVEDDFEGCDECEGSGQIEDRDLPTLGDESDESEEATITCPACNGSGKVLTSETISTLVEFIMSIELP